MKVTRSLFFTVMVATAPICSALDTTTLTGSELHAEFSGNVQNAGGINGLADTDLGQTPSSFLIQGYAEDSSHNSGGGSVPYTRALVSGELSHEFTPQGIEQYCISSSLAVENAWALSYGSIGLDLNKRSKVVIDFVGSGLALGSVTIDGVSLVDTGIGVTHFEGLLNPGHFAMYTSANIGTSYGYEFGTASSHLCLRIQAVPEPASLVVVSLGLLAATQRRRLPSLYVPTQ